MRTRNTLALGGLGLLVVCIHLLTTLTGSQYYLTQLTMSAYYGLVIIGLGTLMGYAGQISIGHAGFFAIGGYLAAALTTRNLEPFLTSMPVRWLESSGLLRAGQDLYGARLITVEPWAACCMWCRIHLRPVTQSVLLRPQVPCAMAVQIGQRQGKLWSFIHTRTRIRASMGMPMSPLRCWCTGWAHPPM